MRLLHYLSVALLFFMLSTAAPTSSSLHSTEASTDLDNLPLWRPNSDITPQPERDRLGASILGPQNVPVELQNPDQLAPPSTDNGPVRNLKWPFALSDTRLARGGWARQQNGTKEHAFYMIELTEFYTLSSRLYASSDRSSRYSGPIPNHPSHPNCNELTGVNMRLEAGAIRLVVGHVICQYM